MHSEEVRNSVVLMRKKFASLAKGQGVSGKRDNSRSYSHEETLQLIRKAQQGDKEAQSLLLKSNTCLVKSIVKRS